MAAPRRLGRPPKSEGAETRRRIVEVAARSFATAGYEKVSMRAIAADVGLTRTALYNYFRTREELARAVLFEHATEVAGTGMGHRWWSNEPGPGIPARERLRALLGAGVTHARLTLDLGAFYVQLIRLSATDPQLRSIVRDYVDGLQVTVRAILDDAIAAGELPPDADTDRLLEAVLGMAWSLASGIAMAPDERVRQQVARGLDLVLDTAPWQDTAPQDTAP